MGFNNVSEEKWKQDNHDWAKSAYPVLSLSTPALDIAECELSDPAPVIVIDKNVSTKVSFRSFNKFDHVTTEIFVTVGQIIEAEHTLRDVKALHTDSLRASIEENG